MGGSRNELVDLLTEELNTKPEILISVWADGHNGQIESLGTSRIDLRKIGKQKFVDRTFTDQKAR